jgi:trehalose-6-phosphate synthase
MAGGVSAALARIWDDLDDNEATWWHLKDKAFQAVSRDAARTVVKLPDELVKGHYRFCNEFFWPIMHDLPEHAYYRVGDYRHYRQFNSVISDQMQNAMDEDDNTVHRWFFVQDYQLGLVPAMLSASMKISVAVFWHIPWPRNVLDQHLPPMIDVARSLLQASVVGFHTRDYAHSFLRFVEIHLPGYVVDYRNLTASPADRVFMGFSTNFRSRGGLASYFANGQTQLVVAPLGLDLDHWRILKTAERPDFEDPRIDKLRNSTFILSVDRADYTKGVLQRISAIDRFFERFPEWRGKVTFAQVCGRTRAGLGSYDLYWQKCRDAADKLIYKWHSGDWDPLIWIDTPLSPAQLAHLYQDAPIMLVNPLKDGLNLTAKEYVACQTGDEPGVLALSPGAGCWHELGDFSVPIDALDPHQIAEAIHRSLSMEKSERAMRMELANERLQANTIDHWWDRFQKIMEKRTTRSVI